MNKQILTLLFLLCKISMEVTINKITLGVHTNLLDCINILTKNVLKIADYKPLGQDTGSVTKSSWCRRGGIRTTSQVPRRARVSGSQNQGPCLGPGRSILGLPSPRVSLSLSQSVSGPPIWTLVTRPQVSLPLGVQFLAAVHSSPRYQVTKCSSTRWTRFSPDPGDAGHEAENPRPAAAGCAGPDRDLGG